MTVSEVTPSFKSPEVTIPPELRASSRWVLYREESRNGRPTKVPYHTSGKLASSTDPETWSDFETIMSRRDSFHGVGFVLGDGWAGIDLDRCRNGSGLLPWASRIVKLIDSYSEWSPSGQGLHILCRGKLPAGRRRFDRDKNGVKIETYDAGRFLTVTGQHLEGTPCNVFDRTKELAPLHFDLTRSKEFLRQFKQARDLWNGNWKGYPSQSEADLALCNYLAKFTRNDGNSIDRLFRLSGLFRDKWDESRGDQTYGQITLSRAVERNGLDQTARPFILRMSDIDPQSVTFLWEPYLPHKKVVGIGGAPGAGKTWSALAICANISKGSPFPGETRGREPASVLYLTAEDGLADTLRVRLDGLKADCSRVFVLDGRQVGEQVERGVISLSKDLHLLRQAIEEIKPVLVVFDPIQGFLGADVDMFRTNEVRPVMHPLSTLAEELGFTALWVGHLTKGSRDRAMYRIQGSVDFSAQARSLLLIGEDPDVKFRRVMVHEKSSLSKTDPSLAFDLLEDGTFAWAGQSSMTAEDILQPPELTGDRAQAKIFLQERLASGPVSSESLLDEAESRFGISRRTMFRAKAELGIIAHKQGKRWEWSTPVESVPL